MRKNLKTVIMAGALAAALLSGTALYAHDSGGSQGSMMGPGMMGQGDMMEMMGQMSQMMAACNQMMQGMMQHHQEQPHNPDKAPQN